MTPSPLHSRARTARLVAGVALVLLGFALVVGLGVGAIEPFGMAASDAASIGALLAGFAPTVVLAFGVFLVGVWLVKGSRR